MIMKSAPAVIDQLQAQLCNELTAINQYFLHSKMLSNWGFTQLAKKEYEESIGEMKHADMLVDRILMLDGAPNMESIGNLGIGMTVEEMLQSDLRLETAAQQTVKNGIAAAEQHNDFVSRGILETILSDTEEHIDYLETQHEVISKVGLQNYLQSIL